jgi:hypothetical protein
LKEDRNKILNVIIQRNHQAVISEQYIQHILIRGVKLGAGYFGTVYLGIDTELQTNTTTKFAIKTINPDIFLTSTATSGGMSMNNLQKIINTFRTEQEVRSVLILLTYFPKYKYTVIVRWAYLTLYKRYY